jgi:hypothetical protein
MINEVFKLISSLKNLSREELIVTEDDEFIMKAFHRKIRKIIKYKLWRKIVINFSIDTMNDIYDSCDILVDEIYKKYNKK